MFVVFLKVILINCRYHIKQLWLWNYRLIIKVSGTLIVLAQRTWQAISGLVTLAFVAHFLSLVEQGYFYTFASLAIIIPIDTYTWCTPLKR